MSQKPRKPSEWTKSEQFRSHLQSLPERPRRLMAAVYAGKAPASRAIKAKCHECVGQEEAIDRIRTCTTYRCPLWSYRPHQLEIAHKAPTGQELPEE